MCFCSTLLVRGDIESYNAVGMIKKAPRHTIFLDYFSTNCQYSSSAIATSRQACYKPS